MNDPSDERADRPGLRRAGYLRGRPGERGGGLIGWGVALFIVAFLLAGYVWLFTELF